MSDPSRPLLDSQPRDPTIGQDVMRPSRMRQLAASQHVNVIAQQLHFFEAIMERRDPIAWEHLSNDEQEIYRESALQAAAREVEAWSRLAHEAGVTAVAKFDLVNGPAMTEGPVARGNYLRLLLLHYTTAVAEVLTDDTQFRKFV